MRIKWNKAFTLIEMSAVIIIILVLVGISLPLMHRGGSHHEAKMLANSIQSMFTLASSFSKAAGKVYLIDTDIDVVSGFTILDPSILSPSSPDDDMYRYSIMKIYSATYNKTEDEIEYRFAGEALEIPATLGAYFNVDATAASKYDHIYFKPDGTLSTTDGRNLMIVCPDGKPELYYKIEMSNASGNIQLTSYKEE